MANAMQDRKDRTLKIAQRLDELYPDAKIALRYSTPWELLVAVILSAQCTDKKVNQVTEELFTKYKTLDDYVNATPREFENAISSITFYKNKAKNILITAKKIQGEFGGKIPDTMIGLLSLSGVARKTANVILGNVYHKVEGIVVDTHVMRFAQKFQLTDFTDPVKIEKDLMELLLKDNWFRFSYQLITYGREVCPARPHPCEDHPLTKLYPPAAKIWPTK